MDKTDNIPLNSFFTVSGSPVVTARFVRLVEGTPYFSEKWMNGIAISEKNERYRSPRVKLDLTDNQLYFLNDQEQEFVCTMPLKELTLTDTVSGLSYHFVHAATIGIAAVKNGWYEQLSKGKASLYRYFKKTLSENKPYGSSVAEQKITTSEALLLAYNGALHSVKKPKDIPAILSDKKAELENYLQSDAMKKGNNMEKMATLVTYYNTL